MNFFQLHFSVILSREKIHGTAGEKIHKEFSPRPGNPPGERIHGTAGEKIHEEFNVMSVSCPAGLEISAPPKIKAGKGEQSLKEQRLS